MARKERDFGVVKGKIRSDFTEKYVVNPEDIQYFVIEEGGVQPGDEYMNADAVTLSTFGYDELPILHDEYSVSKEDQQLLIKGYNTKYPEVYPIDESEIEDNGPHYQKTVPGVISALFRLFRGY